MKQFISRMGYVWALAIMFSCSQPETEEPTIETSTDATEVTSEYMQNLIAAYKIFVENLTQEEKNKLIDFVNTMPERRQSTNGRIAEDVACRCLTTQAHCSSKGSTGECCICWDPETQVGACGKYMGIAFCRVEERVRKGNENDQKTPTPKSSTTIKIYPSEMQNLIDYIERNKLGNSSSQSSTGFQDFKKLIGAL
jgi:hypothetical protein